MKITRARAIKGIIGGAAAAAVTPHMTIAASMWERMPQPVRDAASQPPSDPEEPRFVDGELLLTLSTTPGKNAALTLEKVLTFIIHVINQLHHKEWVLVPIAVDSTKTIPPSGVTVRLPLKGERVVMTAVNFINKIRSQLSADLAKQYPGSSIKVQSAMPNWYVSSAPLGWAGGPGGLPTPAPAPINGQFQVPPALSWPQNSPAPNPRVAVAVLDTWPWGVNPPLQSNYPPVQGFQQHWSTNNGTYHSYIMPDHTSDPTPPPPPVQNFANGIPTYCFADHGLFVAGIIDTTAPHAQIHLMRVLDDYGIGTTESLLAALTDCIALAQCQPLVVNMSLFIKIPPDDLNGGLYWYSHDPNWSSRLPDQLTWYPAMTAGQAQLVLPLHQAVLNSINALLSYGAVVVAAAGNDGLAYAPNPAIPVHLQPRLPADYDPVLGVVATARNGSIAHYSNFADAALQHMTPPPNEDYSNGSEAAGDSLNCIATWGGQATLQNIPQGQTVFGQPLPHVMRGALSGPNDAVVGLCSTPTVNSSGDNTTGWISWSGTSFATAIISAIAANGLAKIGWKPSCSKSNQNTGGKIQQGVSKMIFGATEKPTDTGCPVLKV
jgi:hypothetical protein